jgi:Fe-S cluster biosynthesis and repair protein YggX
MTRTVQCVLLGKEAEALDYAPYPGDLGRRIFENVSKQAWQQWVGHQTMLINENRLTPIEPAARKFLEEEMEKFFFGSGSEAPPDFVPEQ